LSKASTEKTPRPEAQSNKRPERWTLNLDEENEVKIQWVLQDFSLKPPKHSSTHQSFRLATTTTRNGQLLFKGEMFFNDLEIHVNDSIFPAHKFVLAAGSPVFAAMLQSEDFTEQKTNILKIDDLEPVVVKELLRFLYTDRVEKMDKLAKDLLMAADKYMVDLLKLECQAALAVTVTIENCCNLLLLDDKFSASELNKIVLDFILHHSVQVKNSDAMKEMKQSHPHLTFQVLDAFMDQQHITSAPPINNNCSKEGGHHIEYAISMSSITDNIDDDSDDAAWNGLFQ